MRTLHRITNRNTSPSRPARPTAAVAMARFCGEIIFPSTPPEELAPAVSVAFRSAWCAADTCNAPNSALEEVSEPVTATPSQPSSGDSSANSPPALAIQEPSVCVWPLPFITYASASTVATVRIAQRSWTSVRQYARAARAGDTRSTAAETTPETNIRLPAAVSQLNLNTGSVDALPDALRMCSPGQWYRRVV